LRKGHEIVAMWFFDKNSLARVDLRVRRRGFVTLSGCDESRFWWRLI